MIQSWWRQADSKLLQLIVGAADGEAGASGDLTAGVPVCSIGTTRSPGTPGGVWKHLDKILLNWTGICFGFNNPSPQLGLRQSIILA